MTTVHEQALRQFYAIDGKGVTPTQVLFSPDGYIKARREREAQGAFGHDRTGFTTYMGLPFATMPSLKADVSVQYAIDEGSAPPPAGVSFRVDHLDPRQTTMQIVGQALTAAQLCDVIRSFLDADDATHWGAFERELDRVVTEHGRFE
jgi:hypothetical protein